MDYHQDQILDWSYQHLEYLKNNKIYNIDITLIAVSLALLLAVGYSFRISGVIIPFPHHNTTNSLLFPTPFFHFISSMFLISFSIKKTGWLPSNVEIVNPADMSPILSLYCETIGFGGGASLLWTRVI